MDELKIELEQLQIDLAVAHAEIDTLKVQINRVRKLLEDAQKINEPGIAWAAIRSALSILC